MQKKCFCSTSIKLFSGISFVRPVEGSFCRACKKFINTSPESHCKTREHYDKFVDIVLGKKTRAFEIEVENTTKRKATEETNSAPNAKIDEEDDDDVEDDSGNWKRQRKAQDDYYVF